MSRETTDVTARFLEAARSHSAATVSLHASIADRLGLGPSDIKALDQITLFGRVSAGDLGRALGLRSASVTALIDRLQAKGFVERVADPLDRRKVIVTPAAGAVAAIEPAFDASKAMVDALLAPYSTDEIDFITTFLHRNAEAVRALLAGNSP